MGGPFDRTEMLLGREAMEKLAKARVAVFGVGGVGGYVVEGLARSGIGALDLIDHDTVDITNLNRQIIATMDTIGECKVDVAAKRVKSINPSCQVKVYQLFYLPSTKDQFDFRDYDYVVDAVDTVAAKMALIEAAEEAGTPIISAMGAGNKLDPSAFRVADIYETSICPLAKVIRKQCRQRGIKSLKVVYSPEEPVKPMKLARAEEKGQARTIDLARHEEESAQSEALAAPEELSTGEALAAPEGLSTGEALAVPEEKKPARSKQAPGSTAFAPSVMGLIIAGEVVKDLAGVNKA